MTFIKGQRVRITEDEEPNRFGCFGSPDGNRFEEETVQAGDEGTFWGLHPTELLADQGWLLVTFKVGRKTLYCPLHEEWLEEVKS